MHFLPDFLLSRRTPPIDRVFGFNRSRDRFVLITLSLNLTFYKERQYVKRRYKDKKKRGNYRDCAWTGRRNRYERITHCTVKSMAWQDTTRDVVWTVRSLYFRDLYRSVSLKKVKLLSVKKVYRWCSPFFVQKEVKKQFCYISKTLIRRRSENNFVESSK